MAGVSCQSARTQSKRATDKSEAVAGLGQVALVGAVAVSGVGVCVRIGRGVSVVAPVFASARLGLSLPTCIQGELGLSAIHSGVEVIGRGAVLVSEPAREDIALPGGISRLCHLVTNGNKLRVNRRALVGIESDGNLQNLGSLSARFLGIVVGTLSVGEVNNGSVSISYGIGRIVLLGRGILAVGLERRAVVTLRREGAAGDGDLVEALVAGTVDDGDCRAVPDGTVVLGVAVQVNHASSGSGAEGAARGSAPLFISASAGISCLFDEL